MEEKEPNYPSSGTIEKIDNGYLLTIWPEDFSRDSKTVLHMDNKQDALSTLGQYFMDGFPKDTDFTS